MYTYKTSLSPEAFVVILKQRSQARGIETIIKRQMVILKKYRMPLNGLKVDAPFVARIRARHDNTVIKGEMTISRIVNILIIVWALLVACDISLHAIRNGMRIYNTVPVVILLLAIYGFKRMLVYKANVNHPENNNEIIDIIKSIVNEFPGSPL